MIADGNSGYEVRTSEGKLLSRRTERLMPLNYDDDTAYMRSESAALIVWLLTAAASGVVGNLAYDALKNVVSRARAMHRDFHKEMKGYEQRAYELLMSSPEKALKKPLAPQYPSRELHDQLIELALDTLVRFPQLVATGSANPRWAEISVRYSADGTWKVHLREIGQQRGILFEIDLSDNAETHWYPGIEESEGFPITVWL